MALEEQSKLATLLLANPKRFSIGIQILDVASETDREYHIFLNDLVQSVQQCQLTLKYLIECIKFLEFSIIVKHCHAARLKYLVMK